jgi:predicted SnoaL-like aldol condensation-catalyzing enzyme
MRKFVKIVSYLLPVIAFTVLMGFMAGCESKKAVTEENKVLERRAWEEVWNQGNPAAIDEIFATDYIGHNPGMPPVSGTEGYKQFFIIYSTAFPDMHYAIEYMIAEGGDKVATLYGHSPYRYADHADGD